MHNNRTTEALLARRALAEKATPGPWIRERGFLVYGPWRGRPVSGKEGILNPADAAHIVANAPDVVMDDIDEILRLRAQVVRLEKEADWLISEKIVEEWNGRFVGAFNADKGGLVVYESQAVAVASWREAARKAVEKVK